MKRILAIALAFIMLCSLISCGKSESVKLDDDTRERFVYLIEESKEMNKIFFGSGLPVYRREGDLIAERLTVYQSSGLSGYLTVSEQSEYRSIDEIKTAAAKVFSEDYLASLYETAFDGVVLGTTGAYLRYHEDDQFLYQNINATDFGIYERIYDYSTMKIVEPSSADYIKVTVESYSLENGQRAIVVLSFAHERGNWYLDSPTY